MSSEGLKQGVELADVAGVKQDKLVSFVVPIYKTEEYLKKSIDSLLNQDYKNIEIIPVLDGESKQALKILKGIKDSRLKEPIVKEHSGAPATRNEGYKHTKGDYVSFWDSDCYAEPGMVRMWIKAFDRMNCDFVYSDYRFTNDQLTVLQSRPFNKYLLTCNNYIATMFPMKREIFPGFDESLKSLQDWDMWLTVVEKGGIGYYLEGVSLYTEYREGISSEGCSKDNWLERFNKVREKHGITGRDICFTSTVHTERAQQLAELYKQDYSDMPSFHPNEYKMVYRIGLYSSNLKQDLMVFGNSPKDCKKVVHWTGMDVEDLLYMPYIGLKDFMKVYNDKIKINFCENEKTRQMLAELGVDAKVLPLPMDVSKIKKPKEFSVYFECDESTANLMNSIKEACPDIRIDDPKIGSLNDFACFISFTYSSMPSENLKRFIASGRPVITNYDAMFANKTEPNLEVIVNKLRDLKKKWSKYKPNKGAVDYYKKLLSVDHFKSEVFKCLK